MLKAGRAIYDRVGGHSSVNVPEVLLLTVRTVQRQVEHMTPLVSRRLGDSRFDLKH